MRNWQTVKEKPFGQLHTIPCRPTTAPGQGHENTSRSGYLEPYFPQQQQTWSGKMYALREEESETNGFNNCEPSISKGGNCSENLKGTAVCCLEITDSQFYFCTLELWMQLQEHLLKFMSILYSQQLTDHNCRTKLTGCSMLQNQKNFLTTTWT